MLFFVSVLKFLFIYISGEMIPSGNLGLIIYIRHLIKQFKKMLIID